MWQRIENQLHHQLPFVVYRKPKQSEVHAIFQNDKSLHNVSKFTESGFVFAPFDSKSSPILILKDESLSIQFTEQNRHATSTNLNESSDVGRDSYINLLRSTIKEIESGTFRKVVLSRFLNIENQIDPITIFKRILSTYNNAFCYLWFHPEVGFWMGATPEILLQITDQHLTTMSLAGTTQYVAGEKPNWGDKELEEQALVTDFIIMALDGRVENLQQSELETTRAGDLLHLRTRITGELKSDNLEGIIEALHPTPAVCGFPRNETQQFILDNEGYDRQFYAGYLGELNFGPEKSTTLYVNLRCMQRLSDTMKVYVGGGVTKDSDAEKEWQETVNKSQTMLRVIQDEN